MAGLTCTRCGAPKLVRIRPAIHGTPTRVLYCPCTHGEASALWIARNPEKRAAHDAVRSAIRRGELVRRSCEVCETPQGQAHHDNNQAPLDVR